MKYLEWEDYLVFITFLVVSVAIGLYHGFVGGKQQTTREYLTGNRSLTVWPTMLSLMVSFQSAIMFLGIVAEMSAHGISFWPGHVLAVTISMVFTERFIVPVLYPLKLTSVFEYLDLRYKSKGLRILASTFGILSAIIYMSLAMYAPCVALYYLSGFPLNVTVPLMAIICICYTAMGGMKAVIWTDVFQCSVMIGGTFIIVVKGIYEIGGVHHIVDTVSRYGRLQPPRITLDPRERHTVWGFTIGLSLYWIAGYGLSQASVQRYCATRTIKQARRVLLLVIPSVFCMTSLVCIAGFIIFTHFADVGCDPVQSGHVTSYNLLFPVYIRQVFKSYPGFTGIFMAMLYGGALSSISSCLSGTSANTWEDMLKPRLPKISEVHATFIIKSIVVVYGCIAVSLVYILNQLPGTIIKLAVQLMGSISSPIFGVFILALCFRKSEYIGAIIGSVFGFVSVFTICVGSMYYSEHTAPLRATGVQQCSYNFTAKVTATHSTTDGFQGIFTISYLWYLPLGALVTVVVGLVVSTIIRFMVSEIPRVSVFGFFPLEWKTGDTDVAPDSLFIDFRRGLDLTNSADYDIPDFKVNQNEFDLEVFSDKTKSTSAEGEYMINKA